MSSLLLPDTAHFERLHIIVRIIITSELINLTSLKRRTRKLVQLAHGNLWVHLLIFPAADLTRITNLSRIHRMMQFSLRQRMRRSNGLHQYKIQMMDGYLHSFSSPTIPV